jgi:FkbM family methyltransferase
MQKKIYIEAGANDGVDGSRGIQFKDNSEYVGILIEPHPIIFNYCLNARKNDRTLCYNVALVPESHKECTIELQLHSMFHPMNSIKKSIGQSYSNAITVPARTLQSILDENNISEVDYFWLDVEGYEHEVLMGIDFNKTKFKHLEVECHAEFIGITTEEEIKMHVEHLKKYNYKLVETITNIGALKLVFNQN